MTTIRLPVGGLEVTIHRPTGAEDLLLMEAPDCDTALALAARVASPADGMAVDWGALCVTDLDALLLQIRRLALGDVIRAEVVCPAQGCGSQVDVAFDIREYLAGHRPRRPRGVEPATEAGWFRLRGTPATFRLPTADDQVAIADSPHPERGLALRCIRPQALPAAQRGRVEAAMEALAPNLSGEIQGTCPDCGGALRMRFGVQEFCLRELRDQAAFLFEEVHLLASEYHWSQAEILALPHERRMRYAEVVRQERSSA